MWFGDSFLIKKGQFDDHGYNPEVKEKIVLAQSHELTLEESENPTLIKALELCEYGEMPVLIFADLCEDLGMPEAASKLRAYDLKPCPTCGCHRWWPRPWSDSREGFRCLNH